MPKSKKQKAKRSEKRKAKNLIQKEASARLLAAKKAAADAFDTTKRPPSLKRFFKKSIIKLLKKGRKLKKSGLATLKDLLKIKIEGDKNVKFPLWGVFQPIIITLAIFVPSLFIQPNDTQAKNIVKQEEREKEKTWLKGSQPTKIKNHQKPFNIEENINESELKRAIRLNNVAQSSIAISNQTTRPTLITDANGIIRGVISPE